MDEPFEKVESFVKPFYQSTNHLTPVYLISGFSIGAGLAAVDIEAKLARTFGCCRRHLVTPTRFKDPNILDSFSSFEEIQFQTKIKKKI